MKPNFLIFMTDQQRGDMQPTFRMAKTPNLDRLAKNGVVFRRAYCPSPHCCPSRATFFSGLYPSVMGCGIMWTWRTPFLKACMIM